MTINCRCNACGQHHRTPDSFARKGEKLKDYLCAACGARAIRKLNKYERSAELALPHDQQIALMRDRKVPLIRPTIDKAQLLCNCGHRANQHKQGRAKIGGCIYCNCSRFQEIRFGVVL